MAEPDRFPQGLDGLPFAQAWVGAPDLLERGRVDPASVRGRMGMYRLLVERTGAREVVGPRGESHIFWGYASQLHWQRISGRLGLGPDGDRIDPSSWWGHMNATLSVLPLRAAIEEGVVPPIDLGTWTTLHASFDAPMRAWQRFFGQLEETHGGADLEPLRQASWEAHLASIHVGLRRHAAAFAHMPSLEQAFARGWTRMVHFLGAAAAPTDFAALMRWGAGALPPRVLRNEDDPLTDLDPRARRVVRAIIALGRRPRWRFGIDRLMWQRAMRNAALRAEAGDILFGDRGRDPAVRRRVIIASLVP